MVNAVAELQKDTQLFFKGVQENPEVFKMISLNLYNMAQTLCKVVKEPGNAVNMENLDYSNTKKLGGSEKMNELIEISINENQEPIVSGRVLHEFLEIDTPYKQWFDRMAEYGFTEGIDHCTILCDGDGFGKAATKTDHALKLDMAKEIAMLQRNEKGK